MMQFTDKINNMKDLVLTRVIFFFIDFIGLYLSYKWFGIEIAVLAGFATVSAEIAIIRLTNSK